MMDSAETKSPMLNPHPAFHGYAPEVGAENEYQPPISLVVIRQSGSRGRTISNQVASQTGMSFFDQDTIDFMSDDPSGFAPSEEKLSEQAIKWIDARIGAFQTRFKRELRPVDLDIARTVLNIMCRQPIVFVGSAPLPFLPRERTVVAHLVAPLADRIAYLCQTERLSESQAREVIAQRDASRLRFLKLKSDQQTEVNADCEFDLVINTSCFGVDSSANLLEQALREREARSEGPDQFWVPDSQQVITNTP